MPTFTKTTQDYVAAKGVIDATVSAISGRHFLGVNAYYAKIRVDVTSRDIILVRLEGPEMDVNKIPSKVLVNLLKVRADIDKWKAGTLPDFPDFSKRF